MHQELVTVAHDGSYFHSGYQGSLYLYRGSFYLDLHSTPNIGLYAQQNWFMGDFVAYFGSRGMAQTVQVPTI